METCVPQRARSREFEGLLKRRYHGQLAEDKPREPETKRAAKACVRVGKKGLR